jgi:hypothetical protein
MPIYLPARAGVVYSVAFAESAAIARLQYLMLETYELWHPSFDEPIRIVNDVTAITAVLEATAPRNPGEAVAFLAVKMTVDKPEESDTAENPSIGLSRPDLSGILKNALDKARGSLVPWDIIERVYASDDLTAPAILPPRAYQMKNVSLSVALANMQASYDDHANEAIPRLTFKREFYPGLVR